MALLITDFPTIADHTIYSFADNDYGYVGGYWNPVTYDWIIAVYAKADWALLDQYNGTGSAGWHIPLDMLTDSVNNTVWVTVTGQGLYSFDIAANGTITLNTYYDTDVPTDSYRSRHLIETDNHIVVSGSSGTVTYRGIRFYQKTGVGTINATPAYEYTTGGYNWQEIYAVRESNIVIVKSQELDRVIFFDATTFGVLTRTYGGDIGSLYMEYTDDKRNNCTPYLRGTRSGQEMWNFVYADSNIEAVENYIPADNAYDDLVFNSGSLYAWWKFDEANGVQLLDSSGNKYDMTITGGYSREASLLNDGVGTALRMTDTGQAITGNIGAFDGTNQSTECWVKFKTVPNIATARFPFACAVTSLAQAVYNGFFYVNDSKELGFQIYDGTTNAQMFSKYMVGLDDLLHLVMTQDATGMKFYINGVLIMDRATPLATSHVSATHYGLNCSDGGANDQKAHYEIDQLVLYNKALSQADVTARYELGSGQATYPVGSYDAQVMAHAPLMYMPCEDAPDALNAVDISGNQNHAVNSGTVLYDGTQLFVDGSISSYVETGAFVPNNVSGLTFEFWMNVDGAFNNGEIYTIFPELIEINGTDIDRIVYWEHYTNGYGGVYLENVANVLETAFIYNFHKTDEYVHVVIKYDNAGGLTSFFINGEQLSETAIVTSTFASDLYFKSVGHKTVIAPWKGYMKRVAVYDTLLTAQQIKDNFTLGSGWVDPSPVTTYQDDIVAQEPICYYPLNETTGTIVNDVMGRADGTIENGTADLMNNTGLDLTSGDTSLEFNGANYYIKTSGTQLLGRWSQFTIECLVRLNANTTAYLINTTFSGADGGFVLYYHDTVNAFKVAIFDGTYQYMSEAWVPTSLEVFHLAVTFDNGVASLYINGIFKTSMTMPTITTLGYGSLTRFTMGGYDGVSYGLNGSLAHVAVFNEVITPDNFRRRYLIAKASDSATNAYIDEVVADTPYFFLPLNDVVDQYPIDVMGNVDAVTTGVPANVSGIAPNSNALSYDGATTYTRIADTDMPSNITTLTVEIWAKSNTATWSCDIVDVGADLMSARDFFLLYGEPNTTTVRLYLYTTAWEFITLTPDSIQDWNHYALTYDGVTLKGYVNGKLHDSLAITQGNKNIIPGNFVAIANDGDASLRYAHIQADYPAFYEIALTETQLRSHYRTGLNNLLNADDYRDKVLLDGALAFYRMTDQQDPIQVLDETYNYHGVIGGGSPTFSGSSVTFNGVDDYIDIPHDMGITDDFQVEFMAKLSLATDQVLIQRGLDGFGDGWSVKIALTPTALELNVVIVSTLYTGTYTFTEEAFVFDKWYHISCAQNAKGLIQLFIDGQEVKTVASGVGLLRTSTIDWHVGVFASTYKKGEIKELAFYPNKLSNYTTVDRYLIQSGQKGGFLDYINSITNGRVWWRVDNDYDGWCKTMYSGYHGTYYNGVTKQPVPLCKESTHSLYFDATTTTQTVHFGDTYTATGGDIDTFKWNNGTLSFSAWIKPLTLTGHRIIFKDGGNTNGVEFGTYNGEFGLFIRYSGALTKIVVDPLEYFSVGQTAFVCATLDHTNKILALYINGVQVAYDNGSTWTSYDGTGGSSIGSGWGYSSTNVWQGYSPAAGGVANGTFHGYIDNVYFNATALDSTTVKGIWDKGFLGSNYEKVRAETFPVLYWDFEDPINTVAIDKIQGVSLTNNGHCSQTTGFNGNGAFFDGTAIATGAVGKSMLSTSAASIPVLNRQWEYSISVWVYQDSYSATNTTIFGLSYDNPNYECLFWIGPTGTLKFIAKEFGTSNSIIVESTDIVPLTTWKHITMTVTRFDVQGIEVKFYIDGVETTYLAGNTTTQQPELDAGSEYAIGMFHYVANNSNHSQFQGDMDEFMHYNHALTQAEVTATYQALASEYQITGTVTQDDLPIDNPVMIYNRTTGKLEAKTISNGSTGAFDLRWREYDPSQEYFVIALDDQGLPYLDPIGHDRITKTEVP